MWVERLILTNFRNYRSLALTVGPEPVVLVGSNGAGKTNLLEAVSLLAPGQGLRRVPFPDLSHASAREGSWSDGSWSVAARVHTPEGPMDIGTGLKPDTTVTARTGRIVRINGETQSGSGILAETIEMVWITPAMDGLFTGPAGDRRRFLDRLILCFDPGYRTRVGHFERAMASRNRLLADGSRDNGQLSAFERIMVDTGVSISAARLEAVAQLDATISARRIRDPSSPFPWAMLSLEGDLERELSHAPAVAVEETYAAKLVAGRDRDRAAGRTLDGPHRADFLVGHGPKQMPARLCSTGEQKALLIGLILAHAELVKVRRDGTSPILLLDEIAAHLDPDRRRALFEEILHLGGQAWMTGTDLEPFDALLGKARMLRVSDAVLKPA